MGRTRFEKATDEAVLLKLQTDEGTVSLSINQLGPSMSLFGTDDDVHNEDISVDRATEILNAAAPQVDPEDLETAFELLDEHGAPLCEED